MVKTEFNSMINMNFCLFSIFYFVEVNFLNLAQGRQTYQSSTAEHSTIAIQGSQFAAGKIASFLMISEVIN